MEPLRRIVAAELSDRLEADIALSCDALFAAGVSGWARAFQALVTAGWDAAKAAGLGGFMEADA